MKTCSIEKTCAEGPDTLECREEYQARLDAAIDAAINNGNGNTGTGGGSGGWMYRPVIVSAGWSFTCHVGGDPVSCSDYTDIN